MRHLIKTSAVVIGSILFLVGIIWLGFSWPQASKKGEFTGALFPEAFAGFGVNVEDLFANYTTWISSANLDAADTVVQTLFSLYNSGNNSSLVDINGDGLSDVLVHSVGTTRKYAILINNGNIGFDLAYKCVKTTGTGAAWYGDCAQ